LYSDQEIGKGPVERIARADGPIWRWRAWEDEPENMNWMLTGIACGSAIAVVVMFMVIRLRPYWASAARSQDDLGDFSMARYELMARLLDGQDLDFLKAQPGYRKEIGENLRRERRRIFRLYLVDLTADFRDLHACARRMVANSEAQHSHLVGSLLLQQLVFWRAILVIEFRLTTGGVGSIHADLRGLIQALETMRVELARTTAVPDAA
jgi:hypothetical protein